MDWNPESTLIWNPESTKVWNPESTSESVRKPFPEKKVGEKLTKSCSNSKNNENEVETTQERRIRDSAMLRPLISVG